MSTTLTVRPTDTGWGVFTGDQLVSEHRTRAEARGAKSLPVKVERERDYTGTLAPAMVEFATAVLEGRPVTLSSSTLPNHGRRLVVSGREADVDAALELLTTREAEALEAMKAWAQTERATLRPLSQSRRRTANQAFMVRFARGLAEA